MESASSHDDGTTRNTTTTGTNTHENGNQLHLNHCDDHCNINHHHDIDGDADGSSKAFDDINVIDCSCPICLRTATEVCGGIDGSIGTPSGTTANNSQMNKGKQHTDATTSSNNDIEFVYSSTCGHIYCFPCIQHLLLHSSYRTLKSYVQFRGNDDDDDDDDDDDSIITTTQNLCPICRAELSYFDLKKIYIHTDENNNEESALKYNIIRSDELVVPKEDATTLPKELYGTKYQSDKEDTLVAAFRFPNFDSESTNTTSNFKTNDDIVDDDDNFGKGIQMYVIRMKDDKEELFNYVTIEKYQYLSKTHTFKGWGTRCVQITDDSGTNKVRMVQLCVWMTFSDNFHFVSHGVTRAIQPTCICTKCMVPVRKVKIDRGVVIVSVYGGDADEKMIRIINPTDSIDPTSNVTQPLPGKPLQYKNSTLWGNVYCQNFTVGFASLHFIRPPNVSKTNQDDGLAFLSYEHPMCSQYVALDDGQPLPSRVLFRNITCPNPYTFCGSICWEEDYGTTWHGDSRLDFKIKFDTKFVCIHSGTIHGITKNCNKTENLQDELEEVLNLQYTFGKDHMTYINAGLPSITNKIVKKYSDEFRAIFREKNVKDDPIKLLSTMVNNTSKQCTNVMKRLKNEDVPMHTISMVAHTLKIAMMHTHCSLTLIMKDLTHTKKAFVQDLSAGLEENLEKCPIDLRYYFE